MDAGLFIYFPRDPGQSIYFQVLDGQDIYLKKNCQSTPSESTVRPPNKIRDQLKPFPNSTDCHTKHIAIPHWLWPSIPESNALLREK